MQPTILFVEDEVESAEMLATFLEMNNFKVKTVHNGNDALALLSDATNVFDLALLDIMVPGVDGREVCRFIRSHPVHRQIPIVFLTAKDAEQDEITGLNLGADDYIAKPASPNLILAHVRTLLRRRTSEQQSEVTLFGVTLIPESGELRIGNRMIELTSMEFRILDMFFQHPKRVFSRKEILEQLSDDRDVFDRTVDVHIKNIRLKLGERSRLIRTFRGLGYGINKEIVP